MDIKKENTRPKEMDVIEEVARVESSELVTKKTGERDAFAERRRSAGFIDRIPITPERPKSSLRYNTPISPRHTTPTPERRPRLPLPTTTESNSIAETGEEPHDLSLTSESSSSGLGLGVMKSGPSIPHQRRTSNTRPHPLRNHKARLPSWHATAKGPESIICECIGKIVTFHKNINVASSPNSASVDFKLFLDANKEIVRAWCMLDDAGDIKGSVVLEEKKDCMHAILVAWGGRDVDVQGRWISQAVQLVDLGMEFAREWEVVTGVRVLGLGVEEGSPEKQREGLASIAAGESDESFSPVKQKDVFAAIAASDTAGSDESMEYIAPPLESVKVLLATEAGGKVSGNNGSLSTRQNGSPRRATCSSHGSNTSDSSNDSNKLISSPILGEPFRYSPSTSNPKLTNLEEAFFHERLERIENFLYQQDNQAFQKIETLIDKRLSKIENKIFQRPATQFSLETFESVLDQHLEKVETRFDKQCDQIQESISKLSLESSANAATFLNQLTRINAEQRKIEDLLKQESITKASLSQIEHHLNRQNEGMSLLDRGTMIQQLHDTVFRGWDALKLEQKRNTVVLMKRLTSEWQDMYRTKFVVLEKLPSVTNMSNASQADIKILEVQAKLFKDSANKTKSKIDTIEQVISALAVSAHFEQQATQLEVDVAVLEDERNELLLARQDSHWTYAAFDEMTAFMWPQGDPETESDNGTDTAADNKDGDVGIQLGSRGSGGAMGGCAIM